MSRDKGQLPGRVSHVEKLGGETLVYVQVEGQGLLTVRLLGEYDWQVDEPVHLTPDQTRAFLFDADGLRIRD
jgi:multiple sugar transport system ATP-binding protein